jgi:hypothetical protein
LSKVADGKRTTGYADEDFIVGAIWQQQRSYTEEEMKLFARSYFREIKLDTTNTLWSDLADRCFEEFKSKLKTTIHYLVVGDLLGNNANSYHPTYFTTIEEAFACWEKSISTEIKKIRC